MNQKYTLGIVLVLLLCFSASAQLQCRVDTSCTEAEALILCLSGVTNAHAELPQRNECLLYEYKLCCGDINPETGDMISPLKAQCSGNFAPIAYLRDITNSHGAIPSYNEDEISQSTSFDEPKGYTIPACLSAVKGISCRKSTTNSPNDEESCILGFTSATNAHVSSCDQTPEADNKQFIICSILSDQDGDTFPADKDCNDENEYINPDAPEIGNGIDDNCDGEIDGDDDQMPPGTQLPNGWYQLSQAAGDQFLDYEPQGITLLELDTGERVFQTTDGDTHALISKKVAIQPGKEYIASIKSSCDVDIKIAFDGEELPDETPSQWGFIIESILDSDQRNLSVEEPIYRTKPQKATENDKWASIIIIVDSNNCQISQPLLELKGAKSPTNYNDVFTPHAFDPFGITTMQASSCCPQGACWNGFTCIANMRTDTFKKENVAAEAEYRCIDGSWVFSKLLYDWNRDQQGSCADEGQCFVLSSLDPTNAQATAEEFYQGKTPLCVNNGESLFDHYCLNGNWTSRTRFLAQKLVEVADGHPYTISCGPYISLLLDDGGEPHLLGGADPQAANQAAANPGQPNENEAQSPVCFEPLTIGPHVPDTNELLIPREENTCINNVCILKYQDDDKTEKVVFATSLNKKIIDEEGNSFLRVFNIPTDKIDEVCPPQNPENNKDFISCDSFDTYYPGRLWYSTKLNAIIYGPEGVLVNPTVWEQIVDDPWEFILSLIQDEPELSQNQNFVQNAQNLRQVYLSDNGERTIRAVLERQRPKETLIAEFEGFSTPVCEYLHPDRIQLPAGAQTDPLNQFVGNVPFMCTNTTDLHLQRIEAVGGADVFWPQFTNHLRTNLTSRQE